MGFMAVAGAMAENYVAGKATDSVVDAGAKALKNSTGGKLFDVTKGIVNDQFAGDTSNFSPDMDKVNALNGADREAINKGFDGEKKKSNWDKLGGIAGGIAGGAVASGGSKARSRLAQKPSVATGSPVQNNTIQTQRQQVSFNAMEETPLMSFSDYLNNEKMR